MHLFAIIKKRVSFFFEIIEIIEILRVAKPLFFLFCSSYAALMLLLFEMGVIWDLHRNYIGFATKMQWAYSRKKSPPILGDLKGLKIPHRQEMSEAEISLLR